MQHPGNNVTAAYETRFRTVLNWCGARLWALLPDITPELMAGWAEGSGVWLAAKPSIKGSTPGKKVAIVPIEGVLTKDGPSWWGSNYDTITKAVTDAAANPEVSNIVLHVDSPGGEVPGALETAGALAQAAKVKPISAMVNGMAASAAYWLASQANSITLTPSGSVGSVGVRTMHVDLSKALAEAGIGVTELHAGDLKTEWSQYRPLDEGAKADMQAKLDTVHRAFLTAVQQGRGSRASADIQNRRFGEGRMFFADDAMGHGLVDTIQSGRDFYNVLLPQPEQPNAGAAGGNVHPFRLALDKAKMEAGFSL